jgi:hypothetical protein
MSIFEVLTVVSVNITLIWHVKPDQPRGLVVRVSYYLS